MIIVVSRPAGIHAFVIEEHLLFTLPEAYKTAGRDTKSIYNPLLITDEIFIGFPYEKFYLDSYFSYFSQPSVSGFTSLPVMSQTMILSL